MSKLDVDKASFRVTKDCLLPGVFFCLFLRFCVAAYPYSGFQKPPMYGDYEAQRHWQEITLQTPAKQWYYNTTQNDLQYWGLDYPALTAYHSLLMGIVAEWMEPESVALYSSRGYESDSHKTFMRWTVFLSDIYIYVTGILLYCIDIERVKDKNDKNVFRRTDISLIVMLLYPGIILIDYGHFQYNCVSLGFFVWATFFTVIIENDILACLFFCLGLNYKQMELYHALPFFFYLLRNCWNYFPPDKSRYIFFVYRFLRLALPVSCSFTIIWFPILKTWEDVVQVAHRLFPINRGVFEDKVSNIWCIVNVFVKLKTKYDNAAMARICLIATGLAVLPSCLDLFFRINKKKFIPSLIVVSLAFFLFSFQVHEKTILLVAIPVLLHLPSDPFMCFWFLLVSSFSMLPLFIKDGLVVPFLATNVIFIAFFSICIKLTYPNAGFFSFLNAVLVYGKAKQNNITAPWQLKIASFNIHLSCLGMATLIFCALFVRPPQNLPYLFDLLISIFSCIYFIFFFLYFYWIQLRIPKELPKLVKFD